METNNKKKLKYVTPKIERIDLFLEQGIAAGSGYVKPQTSEDVQQEWETESDDNRSFNWDW